MRSVQPPAPQFHGQRPVYVPASLASSKFVYVRRDSHRHPLQRPYDGPYRVLNKSDKFFTVEVKGRAETISIDRLKAAFVTQLTTSGDNKRDPLSAKTPPSSQSETALPPPSNSIAPSLANPVKKPLWQNCACSSEISVTLAFLR
ncbi:Pol polyprotein [Elysia marginata]|uniref:Pol polyprotein n=1 Tax=Elysia marginata TaxID=1093978 RepID=A0AAV4EX99_9GAST|nr:Pol polyprotein [Elysia marginata]